MDWDGGRAQKMDSCRMLSIRGRSGRETERVPGSQEPGRRRKKRSRQNGKWRPWKERGEEGRRRPGMGRKKGGRRRPGTEDR